MGSKYVDLDAEEVGNVLCPTGYCGVTEDPELVMENVAAEYNNCKWAFSVIRNYHVRSDPCPLNYINVSLPVDTEVVTVDNFCGIVNSYLNGNGCINIGGVRYSATDCVEIHESKHFELSAEYLTTDAKIWLEWRSSLDDLPIICEDPIATHCYSDWKVRYIDIAADASTACYNAWNNLPPDVEEAICVAEAAPCYGEYALQICIYAFSQGWPHCPYCP